jgi:hypothetical protein
MVFFAMVCSPFGMYRTRSSLVKIRIQQLMAQNAQGLRRSGDPGGPLRCLISGGRAVTVFSPSSPQPLGLLKYLMPGHDLNRPRLESAQGDPGIRQRGALLLCSQESKWHPTPIPSNQQEKKSCLLILTLKITKAVNIRQRG